MKLQIYIVDISFFEINQSIQFSSLLDKIKIKLTLLFSPTIRISFHISWSFRYPSNSLVKIYAKSVERGIAIYPFTGRNNRFYSAFSNNYN